MPWRFDALNERGLKSPSPVRFSDIRRERIAIFDTAALETALEPFRALCRGAVVETVRHHIATGLLLQRIVADLVGGVQRLLEVTGFENALLLGELAPDAGITIRLKLDTHRHLVGIHGSSTGGGG